MSSQTTRRDLLTALPALAATSGLAAGCKSDAEDSGDTGVALATPTRSPEPEPWTPDGALDDDAFPYGLQLGDPQTDGAVLSVHAPTETSVTVVLVVADGDAGWVEVERLAELALNEDGRLQLTLSGLDADTAYSVVALTADGRRSAPSRFRTALADDDLRVVTFGATSCLGGNHPWPNLSEAAGARYDFFCLLGDTVYADGSVSREDYAAEWDAAMRTRGLKDLSGSTGLIPTWDDHEVDNNWSWADPSIPARFEVALAEFRAHLPWIGGQGVAGLWRKMRWGATLEVFVLDCRGERDAAAEQYISPEQMDWLKAELSASTARFKIILNSVPITDCRDIFFGVEAEDRWEGYPDQRSEILGHIADEEITGVLWIAGDVHLAAVCNVDIPGEGGPAADQWEVIAGPSGSFLNIVADLVEPTEQYPVLFAVWNHTRFTCDPGLGTIHVEFIDDAGEVIAEKLLEL